MRIRTGCLVLLIAAAAHAQTTTSSGTFSLVDPDNVLGQGSSVSLTATNATYAATATFDSTTTTQIDAIQFAAAPASSSGTFNLSFDNGTSAIQTGTFNIDGSNANASVTFTSGTTSMACQAAFGTVSIAALTSSASALSALQGTFNLVCSSQPSTVSGTFTFASSTTTSPTPPPPPTPTPQPPGGGSGGGGIPGLVFPGVGKPGAPASPAPPLSPTLAVSGPPQALLVPTAVAVGGATTLQFATAGNSTFSAPVTLSATSDQPGLGLTFSRNPIPAPGTGTSNLTIDTSTAAPGTFFITVVASGGSLTASTTFELDVLCDPPVITGLDEPASITIASGRSAQLFVAPIGIGVFAYQWYRGFPGLTTSPVEGANGPTLITPPLTATTQFWVRVINACGSVDSSAATVTVSP